MYIVYSTHIHRYLFYPNGKTIQCIITFFLAELVGGELKSQNPRVSNLNMVLTKFKVLFKQNRKWVQ